MKLEFMICWRYLITKRKERFISLISVISILGVAIGVAALIIVIAVMSGFDRDLHDKIIGNYSNITITSSNGIEVKDYQRIVSKVKSDPEITGISPVIMGQALIKTQGGYYVADLRGIEPSTSASVINLDKHLEGILLGELSGNNAIIGRELALLFDLQKGDEFEIIPPSGKSHKLKVAGTFHSGMYEYDSRMVVVDIKATQDLLGLKDRYSAAAVKIKDLYAANSVKNKLYNSIGYEYLIKTWMEINPNFFAALKLEKLTMFILLTLIILVASLNIASTLIVMVVEKTKDIGILRAIGMNNAQVRKIFILEGLIIGALGTFIGTTLGVLLCGLLKKYQFVKLPQDIYYLDRIPVYIQLWPDLFLIVASAMLITLVSTVYPASKAAGFKLVDALRYE